MGCFICVLIIYKPLIQFVNMCAGLLEYSSLRVVYIVITSVLKMFCRSRSLIANSIFFELVV